MTCCGKQKGEKTNRCLPDGRQQERLAALSGTCRIRRQEGAQNGFHLLRLFLDLGYQTAQQSIQMRLLVLTFAFRE